MKAGSEAHRRVLWSRGWAYLRAGRHDDAITLWQEAARLHGGYPFWLPYSLAGAYAAKGDLAQAATWFDAQVAADSTWGNEAGLDEHTSRWNKERQEWMRLAFGAWRQRGPFPGR